MVDGCAFSAFLAVAGTAVGCNVKILSTYFALASRPSINAFRSSLGDTS